MLIGLTGTHCTGKSTISRELANTYGLHEISNSIRDQIAKFPQYTDDFFRGNETFQFHFLHQHILRTYDPHHPSVSDRTSIDYLAYYMRLKDKAYPEIYEDLALSALINYDFLFYFPIEFPFIDDTLRFKNDTREEVDKLICQIIRKNNIDVVPVTGSVQERINTIIDTLTVERMLYCLK